jgi:hypothetical protein
MRFTVYLLIWAVDQFADWKRDAGLHLGGFALLPFTLMNRQQPTIAYVLRARGFIPPQTISTNSSRIQFQAIETLFARRPAN